MNNNVPTYLGISSGIWSYRRATCDNNYDPCKMQLGDTAISYYQKLQKTKHRLEEKNKSK